MCSRFYAQAGLKWASVSSNDARRLFGTDDTDGFKLALRRYMVAQADRRLADDPNRSAGLLREVKPTSARWPHLELGERWPSTQLSRLRLGISRLNLDQYCKEYADSPVCDHCGHGVLESRDHFLLNCPAWDAQRSRLWEELAAVDVRGLQLPCDAPTLLGSRQKCRNRSQLERIAAATRRFVTRTGRLKWPSQAN